MAYQNEVKNLKESQHDTVFQMGLNVCPLTKEGNLYLSIISFLSFVCVYESVCMCYMLTMSQKPIRRLQNV